MQNNNLSEIHSNLLNIPLNETLVESAIDILGQDQMVALLKSMLMIREFETRGEAAYLEGLVGGFYHSYAGEEAIASSIIHIAGKTNYFYASYRCHGVAILLDIPLFQLASELLGRESGCALGRGGSMHMCGENFPGGFGIVGGQIPIAAGGAFQLKFSQQSDKIAICFCGDGAVAQGVFHETLNFASIHKLPLMLVVENNGWGMGTCLKKAISSPSIANNFGHAYGIRSFTLDGFNIFNCLVGFKQAYDYMMQSGEPTLIECIGARFRGHSISDPNLYRSKSEMAEILQKDPIILLQTWLEKLSVLSSQDFNLLKEEVRSQVVDAFTQAKNANNPNVNSLEEGVYAE